MTARPNLTGLSISQLTPRLAALGCPPYRSRQLFSWIHRSLAQDFSQMNTLPQSLQAELSAHFNLGASTVQAEAISQDGGTRKVLFSLLDGETIESVLMSYGRRRTICLSTQVGCSLGCPFCATGQSGFVRDLTVGEIVDQILHFARFLKEHDEHLTHAVFMGMGEPLMNYDATWQAIRILTDPHGQALSARRLTISTAGWVTGIRRAAKEGMPVKLALSLHAPTDALRDRLVPLNRRYPLVQVLRACREYGQATGRRLTLEYALMDRLNDDSSQAEELARLFRGIPIHVNLIPLSPTAVSEYHPSSSAQTEAFLRSLKRLKVPYTFRSSRGLDIEASCGQLRQRTCPREGVEKFIPNSDRPRQCPTSGGK